ncbi:MAG: tRNA guanosine(15) transglycosylase TgtA [Candidatus Hodarchaeales archaeon]
MVFTIRSKDGMGRIGTLETASGTVETPALMPVLNPRKLTIKPSELTGLGAEIFITNSYLIYRDEELREIVSEKGLHGYLGFNGPVMTDSGAFQLMLYGDIEINNREITAYQEKIQTDIGVFLDVPVKKGKRKDYEKALEITNERALEHIEHRKETNLIWTGPVQGGPYPDLVEKAAQKMARLDFGIHALGSVVPLMEQYKYSTVLEMILAAKKHLPSSRPLHLFGAGHPMFFAITSYLGCDLYDSAAYALFAKRGDYITATGTRSLAEIDYFPCSCPVCQSTTPAEMKKLPKPEKEKLLSMHNISVSFEEIRRVKQAIKEGRLLNLAYERSRCHPELAKAFNDIVSRRKTAEFIERFDSIKKRKALLIPSTRLGNHPSIIRFQKQVVENFYSWAETLVVHRGKKHPVDSANHQSVMFHPVFGPVPEEIAGIFPTFQYVSINFPPDYSRERVDEFISKHGCKFKEVIDFTIGVKEQGDSDPEDINMIHELTQNENRVIKARIDLQYGAGASRGLDDLTWKVARTGIPRAVICNNAEIASVRASDQLIIPNMDLAKILHENLMLDQKKITVLDEVGDFIKKGKSVYCKHVVSADESLRSGEHALVVSESGDLLAVGECLMSGWEMTQFSRGIAAKNKKH